MAETKIEIKLLVDKEKNKIIFAESDKDFVDVLFSFLTLPIGTIIRLSNKKSELGCMDALYRSVETLDAECFQTEACRFMLLRPKSAVQNTYRDLVVNVDDSTEDQVRYFRCSSWTCCTETHRVMSMFENATCICGQNMDQKVSFYKLIIDEKDKLGGVFVKGIRRFTISDDLQVRCVSAKTSLSLLFRLGIPEGASVEERLVTVGEEEMLNLLKHSLLSKTPMTDVFLLEKVSDKKVIKKKHIIKSEPKDSRSVSMNLTLNLLVRRSINKVLCAVVEHDFLDFLFSFLAVPVGSIVKFRGGYSCLGSMDNLYKSVEGLCNENPEKFSDCEDMLLNPKIACHHGSGHQILQMDVQEELIMSVVKCPNCFRDGVKYCTHMRYGKMFILRLLNPRSPAATIENGMGFVKDSTMFMVTDELVVEPLSQISIISLVNKLGVPFEDLEERTVTLGEKGAVAILEASLSSKTALTDAFCKKI